MSEFWAGIVLLGLPYLAAGCCLGWVAHSVLTK